MPKLYPRHEVMQTVLANYDAVFTALNDTLLPCTTFELIGRVGALMHIEKLLFADLDEHSQSCAKVIFEEYGTACTDEKELPISEMLARAAKIHKAFFGDEK